MVTALINNTMTKIFGSRNGRLVKSYRRRVEEINAHEPAMRQLSDAQMREKADALRKRIADGANELSVLPEAFALMREAMDRHIGLRNAFDPAAKFDINILPVEKQTLYQQVQAQCKGEHGWRFVEIPLELYAAIRDAVPADRPPFRARPFDVQLIGGMVLFEGKIAEMATGEGKTFVAPLACGLMGLTGKHCHVVTVNDYLVRRDASWVAPAFHALGMSVGYIQAFMENDQRQAAYQCTVTYGTNSEFGFDYLRDNMKRSVAEQVQGPLDYAIVDEVDSILIDEARTPLIISGPANEDAPRYAAADEVARKLMAAQKPWEQANDQVEQAKRKIKGAEGEIKNTHGDAAKAASLQRLVEEGQQELKAAEDKLATQVQLYEVEFDKKSAHLTHEGIQKAQEYAGVGSFYIGGNMDWPHLLEQSLRAHVVYEHDKDYVVQNGEVIIVDEFTGRLMVGRQWNDGLHQAVEAKEKVEIKPETQTMATITLQNFFKLYKRIGGMTGTAMTEAEEFAKIYKLDVVTIPTNRPLVRDDQEDLIFMNENAKWNAIVEQIKEVSDRGQPVLVGTTSVEKSQRLSAMLTKRHGIQHEVLNAKNHEREADIVAQAGRKVVTRQGQTVGAVTIATNMAGRGTDIKLGPNVMESGGLYVLGTERHEARRIDNQLRGRAGRQGDPGGSRFFLSLEDELMKLFAGDFTLKALQRLGMKEDEAIEHRWVSKAVERAQKKVEERNFGIRKNLLEYDEVRDFQRNFFYKLRQDILEGRNLRDIIFDTITDAVNDAVNQYLDRDYVAKCIAEWASKAYNTPLDAADVRDTDMQVLESIIKDHAREEARSSIDTSILEFMDPDADPADWNLNGLSHWIKERFDVAITPGQIRQIDRVHIVDQLTELALHQIEQKNCAPVTRFLAEHYPQHQLADWANNKFNLKIKPEELYNKTAAQAEEIILAQAREAYSARELAYPVDYAIHATQSGGGLDNIYASEQLAGWVNAKYGSSLTSEEIRQMPADDVRNRLVEVARHATEGMDEQVEQTIAKSDSAALAAWVSKRFLIEVPADEFDGEPETEKRERLQELGHAFLRQELTEMERNVLLQILDVAWKDHLYAMDQLRDSIGLRGIAEKDPRIEYKREGSTLFEEFQKSIRDKVTDIIFKIEAATAQEMADVYADQQEIHEVSDSYGVGESAAAESVRTEMAAATAGPVSDDGDEGPEGVGRSQEPVQTFVHAGPRVGRNEPCPCGSGKKYKQCCGKNA